MKLKKSIYNVFLSLILLFLYSPIFILILNSFNASRSRTSWGGFTFKWYSLLFKNHNILSSLENTILIALVSSIIAAILGTLACVGVMKSRNFFQSLMINLNNIPMINPEIVVGISSMIFFVTIFRLTGLLKPGLLTLIISHSTFCAPYVFLSVLPRVKKNVFSIFEAAQDLGCTPFQAFLKAILPEISQGIISGIVMSFTMSIDDFTISYFTSGSVQTLPLTIYSMTRISITPEINALSTMFFFTILILLIVINLIDDKIEWI